MDQADKPTAAILRHARRAQWACGLCLGSLLLMGVSGIASITLLHDDPLYRTGGGGIEGATLNAVIELRWLIELIHGWGGYPGIVLAGWAALEVFRFARRLRRSGPPQLRRTGAWLGPAGLIGGALITIALVLLIASGVAASGFVDHIGSRHRDEWAGLDKSTGLSDARRALQGYEDSRLAELHIREMNYLLALGALILVAAAAGVRGAAGRTRPNALARDA